MERDEFDRLVLPLRACPFCGHKPRRENLLDSLNAPTSEVGCPKHEGGCGASVCGEDLLAAVAAWNRRADDAPPDPADTAMRRQVSGMSVQQWNLWRYLTDEMDMNPGFYRSDVFELLAAILAYYEASGTPPNQMLGEHLKRRVTALLLWSANGDEVQGR